MWTIFSFKEKLKLVIITNVNKRSKLLNKFISVRSW